MGSMPTTSSGKINHNRLRSMVDMLSSSQLIWLVNYPDELSARTPFSSSSENRFAKLWAQDLMIEASDICREDPIFRLGGNSLHVMRLTTTAHDEGLFLSTRDVFQTPHLAFLAQLMIPLRPGITEKDVYKPFCLLLNSIDVPSITRHVESVLSIDISDTNDLLSSDGFDTCTHWHKGDPLLVSCSFSKHVILSDSRF